MKIIAIMMVYNSADVILKALESIDGKVDEILCFDSRWIGYNGSDHSTDGTDAIIRQFSMYSHSSVFYISLLPMHQWQARTEALKYVQNGNWVFIYDSDECIIEWENEVRNILENSSERTYRICQIRFKPYTALPIPCLFRKTETLRYSTDHRRIFDKDGEIDIARAPLIHIVVDHQPIAEKKAMRQQSEEYKRWLLEYETTHWNPEDVIK